MSISRRDFLGTAALGAVTLSAATRGLPTRVLGRTGRKVSILAFGAGSRFLMYKEEDRALAALTRALDLGITYVDTAYSYGDGLSEERVGKGIKGRRNELFVATKINKRNGDEAMRIIEGSLKRLQTDHVDLLHVHSLTDMQDLAAIEAPDGVLKVLYKLRDQKVARAIGVTSHSDPAVLKTALERNDFDCTQMALNAALVGMANAQSGFEANPMARPASFEGVALPVARRKNMGVIAMKVFAQEHLLGKASPDMLLRYSLSLPVTAATAGMPKLEHIEANIEVARNFKPLTPAEMEALSSKLAAENKAALDRLFLHHIDA
jgi:aryl-alcohol dehydrogenase-like predicted oxidoreductase